VYVYVTGSMLILLGTVNVDFINKQCVYVADSESIGIDERLDETWVTVFGYVLVYDADRSVIVVIKFVFSEILA